jgi:hypothetical protein
MADEIQVQSRYKTTHRYMHKFVVTCATSAATVTTTDLQDKNGDSIVFKGQEVVLVEIDPGSTGPTNGAWDLLLTTDTGINILGDGAANLSSTVSVALKPEASGNTPIDTYPIWGNLAMSVTGNAVNNASFTIVITFDIVDRKV